MGLFEVDEASVPKVAAEAKLGILAVLNLFRDQLDRYGELAYTGRVVARPSRPCQRTARSS